MRELIVNGGFQTGDTFGWTVVGPVRVISGFAYSGTHSIQFGSKSGGGYYYGGYYSTAKVYSGQISQSFSIPAGVTPTLKFWYFGEVGDEGTSALVVTLLDQSGAVISQWNGLIDYKWHQVAYNIDSKYAGSTVTLRFLGTPDLSYDTETWCPINGFPCRTRVYTYGVYVYVNEVSVSYG
jgi:serine protease